jgi:hypothetical protein
MRCSTQNLMVVNQKGKIRWSNAFSQSLDAHDQDLDDSEETDESDEQLVVMVE